jgi:flagellar basal body-associated protein FliL
MLIKNMGVRGKFIWIISIATVVLLTCMALVIIWDASKSQSRQASSFISTLKAEQIQEEKLLRKTLINKGKALTDLMAQIAAGLIIGFEGTLIFPL